MITFKKSWPLNINLTFCVTMWEAGIKCLYILKVVKVSLSQSCPAFCYPMDSSPPDTAHLSKWFPRQEYCSGFLFYSYFLISCDPPDRASLPTWAVQSPPKAPLFTGCRQPAGHRLWVLGLTPTHCVERETQAQTVFEDLNLRFKNGRRHLRRQFRIKGEKSCFMKQIAKL